MFHCPGCSAPLLVCREGLGRWVECPKCAMSFAATVDKPSSASYPPSTLYSPGGPIPNWLADVAQRERLASKPPVAIPHSNSFAGIRDPNPSAAFSTEGRASPSLILARRALLCVAALLLVMGQFCPMLIAPMEVSVNFFDYSTKAAWLLSKAASEAMDQSVRDPRSRQPVQSDSFVEPRPSSPRGGDPQPAKPSEALKSIALVVGLALRSFPLSAPLPSSSSL